MANSSMIQVAGLTYRIEHRHETHDVFRLRDDFYVGSFSQHPRLHVVCSTRTADEVMQIARSALRAALLPFSSTVAPPKVVHRLKVVRLLSDIVASWQAA